MGCCFSKNEESLKTPPPHFHLTLPESNPSCVRAPLSPVFEEESVKEVLSETSNNQKPPSLVKIEEEVEEEEKISRTQQPSKPSVVLKIEEEKKKVEVNVASVEEISEVSEICSLSESISTTTITERKEEEEEDGEVQQRVHRSPAKLRRKRSIPGDFAGRHERGCKSPARRLDPSPVRRNDNALKAFNSSEVGQNARRRMSENNNNNNRVRRDSGERSGRRSRSPATRVNSGTTRQGIGRSQSKKAPRSPGRIPAVSSDNSRKPTKTTKDGNSTNESLENPLVSLECFIFL